jgi:hypothetical protein
MLAQMALVAVAVVVETLILCLTPVIHTTLLAEQAVTDWW